MEKLSANQKNNPKQYSNKAKTKKPVKVVYISNPMKVKATPAEFRALVQELTGRDSTVADLSELPEADTGRRTPSQAGAAFRSDAVAGSSCVGGDPDVDLRSGPFDALDNAFPPQMLDNFGGLSSVLYDSHGYGLRDPDKV